MDNRELCLHHAPNGRRRIKSREAKEAIMTTIINRIYAAEEQAVAAVNAVKHKFSAHEVNLVTPTSGHDGDIEAAAVKGGVRTDHAAVYADHIRQGGALVTVHAPWGFAKQTIKALDAHGPIDSGLDYTEHHAVPGWHSAAPFSALLGLPAVSKFRSSLVLGKKSAPFSDSLKLPTLLNSKSSTNLSDNPAPFSSIFRFPTINRSQPYSTLVENDKSHTSLLM
jgi:hypothetical protein